MKNLTIRMKIMIPMCILVLCLFVTCIISGLSIGRMKTAGEEISGKYAVGMSLLGDLSTDVEILQKLAYAHCTATDYSMKGEVEKEIDVVSNRLLDTCKAYEDSLNEKEKTLYEAYKTKFDSFMTTFNTVIVCSSSYQ